MNELDEVATNLHRDGARHFDSFDHARTCVKLNMPDETPQVIDGVAWSLWRTAQAMGRKTVTVNRSKEVQERNSAIARGAILPHEIDALGSLGIRIQTSIDAARERCERDHEQDISELYEACSGVEREANNLAEALRELLGDPREKRLAKMAKQLRTWLDRYESEPTIDRIFRKVRKQ